MIATTLAIDQIPCGSARFVEDDFPCRMAFFSTISLTFAVGRRLLGKCVIFTGLGFEGDNPITRPK